MTPKQKRFVELSIQYAPDWERAYLEAYGCNIATARSASFRLMQNVTIRNEIDTALHKIVTAREEITNQVIKEEVKAQILSREQRMEIASNIAKGESWKTGGVHVVPSASDRIRALDYLAKMNGDYAPQKITSTTKQVYVMPDGTEIEF